MAAKGEKETVVFKLSLKVDLIDKRKENKNAVEKLQKAFQTNIVLLRQHLKGYPDLQSQHINCVTKKKKHLWFEFWLKSVKALEELKLSIENNSLVTALSDFSEKRGFNLDVGLDSQHLCFRCKMEKKHYAQGVAHFIEDSSESSDEDVEEAADQQKQSNMPQGAPCGTAPQEKKVFGELKKEEMTPKETTEMKNEASIFEQSKISGTSAPAGPPTGTNNKEPSKYTSLGNTQSMPTAAPVTLQETNECVIVKQFYLYLPFKDSEIETVVMESNCGELHGQKLQLVRDYKHLWELKVMLNPNILDRQVIYCFVVEQIKAGYLSSKKVVLKDDNEYKIDSSAVQRIFWKKVSEDGFFCHAQHIVLLCGDDMKDSILQMEALVTVVSPNLNKGEVIKVVKNLEKDNFWSDNKKSLMFGVLIGCSKVRRSLMEVINDNVIQVLFHVLCHLKRTDIPLSCVSYLHELSFHVMRRKYGKEFSLIHWMTHMFPFEDESKFLEEIKWCIENNMAIATSDDEKMTALTVNVCTAVKERIQKGESEKGPELILSLIKHLPLSAAMKVHNQSIDKEAEFTHIREKIVDGLVVKIGACALKHFNDNNIGKLRYLWDHVKIESYAHLLTANFEKHILSLLEKTSSFNDDHIAFIEDETLFAKGPNQESLLRLIAKSPTKSVHDHMKALAQQRKYMPAIGTVAETWLETAVTKHVSSGFSSQRPISMYSYLWDAISLQKDGNDEKLVQRLENKLYTMKIKYLRPADLLKIADQILTTSRDTQLAQEIFQQHLMRLLKEQHGSEDTVEILNSVFGKNIWITANWQGSLVATLLDLYAIKDGRVTQANIFSMLPHQNFWKAILKVQGVLSREVKMHPAYIAADDCITSLRKSLKDMTVTVGFIDKIATEGLILKVASFLSDDYLPEETCLFLLREYHSSVIKQREIITLVGNTLGNITNKFPGDDGLGMLSVKDKVHKIAEVLKTGTITIRDMKETLWQPYDSVPSICEKLQIPCKSNVFWKVCLESNIGKDMVKHHMMQENLLKERLWVRRI